MRDCDRDHIFVDVDSVHLSLSVTVPHCFDYTYARNASSSHGRCSVAPRTCCFTVTNGKWNVSWADFLWRTVCFIAKYLWDTSRHFPTLTQSQCHCAVQSLHKVIHLSCKFRCYEPPAHTSVSKHMIRVIESERFVQNAWSYDLRFM